MFVKYVYIYIKKRKYKVPNVVVRKQVFRRVSSCKTKDRYSFHSTLLHIAPHYSTLLHIAPHCSLVAETRPRKSRPSKRGDTQKFHRQKKRDVEVLDQVKLKRDITKSIRTRKFKDFGHIRRHITIMKTIPLVKVEGKSGRGRQWYRLVDNLFF